MVSFDNSAVLEVLPQQLCQTPVVALPQIDAFELFLEGARVVDERPASGASEFVGSGSPSMHGPGSEVWIAYDETGVKITSVLRKIEESLLAVGSPSGRHVALALLAIVLGTKHASGHVAHANRLLSDVRIGDLWLNFVTPTLPDAVDIRVNYGPIGIEPFDPTRMEYWSTRGGSRWPLNPRELRGHAAAVSRVREQVLINTDGAQISQLRNNWSGTAQSLVDPYYQAVLDVLSHQVGLQTAQRMSLAEAAGFTAFDYPSFAQWSLGLHLFTWRATNTSPVGCWALFRQPVLVNNISPAGVWNSARDWLTNEFGIDSLATGDRPIDVTAQTFAALMQDARKHLSDRRFNEALLYFVIALDHLLGEQGASTSSVADRASVLTHVARTTPFDSETKAVRKVYDARSRLVHRGEMITEDQLREAESIATAVLWALTRVVSAGIVHRRDDWTAQIDRLAHLLRGDPLLVSSARLAEVGVRTEPGRLTPPPVLRDRGVPPPA